jgi:hypothetical protein
MRPVTIKKDRRDKLYGWRQVSRMVWRRRWRPSLVAAIALALSLSAGAALAQQAKEPDEKPTDFPDGPHREDTFYFCTACHGFKIVASQGMSRDRWDETLDWMEARHNLPKTDGQDRARLLDYLATAFPERQGPRGWKSPLQR